MRGFNQRAFVLIKNNPRNNPFLSAGLMLLCLLFYGTACAPLQVIEPALNQQSLGPFDYSLEKQQAEFKEIKPTGSYKPFPLDYNNYVKKWLSYYSYGAGKEHMRRYLERSSRYLDYMGDILEKQGLPRELVYMSMNESGFWPYAKSSANAIGYWQFIQPTGKSYDLTINRYIDERQDFALSTQAAADYLKDLYAEFQDWRLSMAGYNCGAGCVRTAIQKYNSKNYWYLVSKKAFPRQETRDFVPKIIAMTRIALRPEFYGFQNLKYQKPLEYQLVSIEGESSLSYISNYFQIPPDEMKALNPKFKTDWIPANSGSHIRIPNYVRD